MAYRGLLRLGGVEIANSARALAYIENGVCAPSITTPFDDTWRHTARYLGHQAYRTPVLDRAPWFDVLDRDSDDFAGVWPMQVDGLDSAIINREVVEGLGDGGTFGPPRFETRKIKVTALLVGRTTVGVDYGLRWLSSILRGDRCKGDWMGQTLEYLSSAPDVPVDYSNAAFADCVRPYRRELHEVACTRMPEITERFGVDRSSDAPHATAYRVEFELTAGIPWAYQPAGLLFEGLRFNKDLPAKPIYFVIATGGVCSANACEETTTLRDPLRPKPASLIRPITPTTNAECEPLESYRVTANVPKSLVPDFHDLIASVTVRAGWQDERQLRIRWVRKDPAITNVDDLLRCNTVSEANVGYVPAGSSLTIDGITGRPYVLMPNGETIDASPVVSGPEGGPWVPPILSCGLADYMVVVDGPGTVSAGLTIDAEGSVRQS